MLFMFHGMIRHKMNDYDVEDYMVWFEEVADEIFALLGSSVDEFDDINFLNLYLEGYEPEAAVREIYESN